MSRWVTFLVSLFLVTALRDALAAPCVVSYPKDFPKAFETLKKGGCESDGKAILYFTGTMDISLEEPLVLDNPGLPIEMKGEEGSLVHFMGQGFTIKRHAVHLKNLHFKNFPDQALKIEANDVSLIQCEISGSGSHGIVITDGSEENPEICNVLTPSKAHRIFLLDNGIHHNKGFGVWVRGYQVQIKSSSKDSSKIHHNQEGGVFLSNDEKLNQCLHTLLVSKVSFYENGPEASPVGIQTEGISFPTPKGVIAIPDLQGNLNVSGNIPLSTVLEDPYRLGVTHPNNFQVEIYGAYPTDGRQGRFFLGLAKKVAQDGTFQILIEKDSLPSEQPILVTTIVIDKVLGVSSAFSELSLKPQEGDTDGDSLLDLQEEIHRTDPRNPDTDMDSLPDGEEIRLKTDPLDPDTDRDGLKDGEEIALGSDPKNPDTDQDSLTDGKELSLKTNPLDPDTDHDGLEDGKEVELGTNPIVPDTDNDGAQDGFEVERLQCDPKICDTDKDGLGDGLEAQIIHPKALQAECRGLQVAGTNFKKMQILNPILADSDGDGLKDGEEDLNHNGWMDFNETDPTLIDSDGDGLDDGFEKTLDQDGDGFSDLDLSRVNNGERCAPPSDKTDLDCDGLMNGQDDDSDNDGCTDSEEALRDSNEDGILDVWQATTKGCVVPKAPSPPTQPSVSPNSGQATPDKGVVPEEVLPARGGGACQLIVQGTTYEVRSWKYELLLVFIYSLLSLTRVCVLSALRR